jgi:hypothetical protein
MLPGIPHPRIDTMRIGIRGSISEDRYQKIDICGDGDTQISI